MAGLRLWNTRESGRTYKRGSPVTAVEQYIGSSDLELAGEGIQLDLTKTVRDLRL